MALTEQMATRYGDHPAVVLWHVSNELGCHNAHCYCDVSAEAFRRWLADRYGDVASLNDAWGTAFWSQRYADWEEVLPPRLAPISGLSDLFRVYDEIAPLVRMVRLSISDRLMSIKCTNDMPLSRPKFSRTRS